MVQQVDDETKFTGIKLPDNISVSHYNLTLTPCLKEFVFSGQVEIKIEAKAPSKDVVLNSNNLVIVSGFQGTDNKLVKVTYSKKSQTATLEFEKPVSGKTSITLAFTGILNDKMRGFYRSSYKIKDQTVHAATTQFEAIDARQCFPCWDEPARKASFEVTIRYNNEAIVVGDDKHEIVALSNMPQISCNPDPSDSKISVAKFEVSPIMSTYLLAFVVGPFEYVEQSDGKRMHRVYVTPGKKGQADFALKTSCMALRYYEDFFQIEYPLPKLDLIAIPDFALGAMENWGLVTYRENCLLVDPVNTSTARKQIVAIVVAHELAHQWFGNLVTMEWWTHLWLNEGFATYMEYLCTDFMYPEMKVWSQFVCDSFIRSLSLDALKHSHPIEVEIKDPEEIDEIFDDISYLKGGSVIRMMTDFMGEADFRKGMSEYLKKYKYSNASTVNLWEELEKASGKPISKLMSSWTLKKGFPVIKLNYSNVGGEAKIIIDQQKFSADGVVAPEDANQAWMVPIKYITATSQSCKMQLLNEKSSEIFVDGAQDTWIKLNPGCVDFYITHYSEEMLHKLVPAIRDQTLGPIDRLGIQSDQFSLCLAGQATTTSVLELLMSYKNEEDYNVWSSIDSSIGRLSKVLGDLPCFEKFQAYARELYSKIYEKVGWESKAGESQDDAMKRALVMGRLIKLNEPKVVSKALSMYQAHLSGQSKIEPDLRACVYQAAAAYGDDAMFEGLFSMYRSTEMAEEKSRLAFSTAYTKDSVKMKKVIDFMLSTEVKNQDKPIIIMSIGSSNPPMAFDLITEHLPMFKDIYGSNSSMSRIIFSCCANFVTAEWADKVQKLFEQYDMPGSDRTIQQAIETIRTNSKWLERDAMIIEAFLANYEA